jgi:hypothetical protein
MQVVSVKAFSDFWRIVKIKIHLKFKRGDLKIMFCPTCGKGENAPDTYCRNCGAFLTDSSGDASLMNRILGANMPEKRVNVGLAFDVLTLIFSSLLLIFLFGYFDRRYTRTGESPPIIYFVYVFLGAVTVWQLLSLIVGVAHKNKLGGRRKSATSTNSEKIKTAELNETTQDRLPPAEFENVAVPPSVTENTTKYLDKILRK